MGDDNNKLQNIKFDKKRYKSIDEIVEEIQRIKQFGEELGLDYDGAFSEISPSVGEKYFWVYASYKHVIESPNGKLSKPYNFFTDESEANNRKKEMDKEDLDTYLFVGKAYGSRKCQITKTMLEAKLINRLNTLLHEGFHTYKNKNRIEIPYNLEEPIACYMGNMGSIQYFEQNDISQVENAIKNSEKRLDYTKFVNRFYDLLAASYENGSMCREIIFEMAKEANPYEVITNEINNAFFVREQDYRRHFELVFDTLSTVKIKDYLKNPTEINEFLIAKANNQ